VEFLCPVPSAWIPNLICDPNIYEGAALQYLDRADGYKECNVIGRYDSSVDDIYYKLLDDQNPAFGVSMTYPLGAACPNDKLRSATIDLICDNVNFVIESTLEPELCAYHIVARSYYGCPTECPVTKNGLCNSHGHCAYDPINRNAYCYCNSGYSGAGCDHHGGSSSSYTGYDAQVALMVVLLIISLGLTGVIIFMVYKVTLLRREKMEENSYHSLPDGTELTKSRNPFA